MIHTSDHARTRDIVDYIHRNSHPVCLGLGGRDRNRRVIRDRRRLVRSNFSSSLPFLGYGRSGSGIGGNLRSFAFPESGVFRFGGDLRSRVWRWDYGDVCA